MKKMNFNNESTGDDKQLIDLLKKAPLQEPSSQFIDNTISKFLAQKKQSQHRPLKIPLILMSAIGLFLVLPLMAAVDAGVSVPDPEIYTFLQSVFLELSFWYLLYPLLLLLTTLLLVLVQMRTANFRSLIR